MKFVVASICCLLVFTCVRADIEEEVLEGVHAKKGQFPYQVYIEIRNSTKDNKNRTEYHACGGSILTDKLILTAAHCVCKEKYLLKDVVLLVGKTNKNARGPWYNVEKIKCHEKFVKTETGNDIALIKLQTELKFKETWKSITLPDSEIQGYPKLDFSGWGLTKNTDDFNDSPTDLQSIELTIVDCNATILSERKDTICAKSDIEGSGTCNGDSGGALVKNTDKGYVQYGIDSAHLHLHECGDGSPTIFTKVSYHKHWIEKTMHLL